MIVNDDLQSRLLSDASIYVGSVPVRCVSYRTIASIGFSQYYHMLDILTMSDEDIAGQFNDSRITNQIGVIWAVNQLDPSFCDRFTKICWALFGKKPLSLSDNTRIPFKGFELNSDNVAEVVNLIKLRNGIRGANDGCGDNPADEATRLLIERRNALRKKVARQKRNDDGNVSFADIVSIYASVAGMPLSTVMQYDMYQLVDQFKRKQMYENYRAQIESMIHGAKIEDKDLKHYVRKISDDPDNE